MDLRSIFYDFSHQDWSFVRSTAVCSATFRRDLLLLLLNPYCIICAVTALQAAAQLEVACLIFRVPRDEHLPIDRPVHFSPHLLVLASSAITLARVGVRLAHLLHHHRPPRRRLA